MSRTAAAALLLATGACASPARRVVEQAIERAGGRETVGRVAAFATRSTGTFHEKGVGYPYETHSHFQSPDRLWVEQRIGSLRVLRACGAEGAWWDLGAGPATIDGPEAAELRAAAIDAAVLLLAPLLGKAFALRDLADDEVRGRPAWRFVALHRPSGVGRTIWLDAETLAWLKMERPGFDGATGETKTLEAYYADSRAVAGVRFPFRTETRLGGQKVADDSLTRLTFNPRLDSTLFSPPPE